MSLEQRLKEIKAARTPAETIEYSDVISVEGTPVPAKPLNTSLPETTLSPNMESLKSSLKSVAPSPVETTPTAPDAKMKEGTKDTSGRDLSTWLVGATPLLVGMLTGNTLEGVDTAAQYYLKEGAEKKEDKNSLQLKIEEMKLRREQEKLKREMAGKEASLKATNTIQEYTDPTTGKVKLGVFDKATGKILETDYLGPKQPGVDDKEARLANQFKKQMDLREKFKLSDRQDRAIKDFTLNTNSPFKLADDNINAIQRAHNILNEGGVVGGEGVRSLIARGVFGEKGVLTEQDVQRIGGDKAATARANSLLQRISQGYSPLPEDRKDLDILLRAAHNFEVEKARKEKDRYVKTQKALGVDISAPLNEYVMNYTLPPLKGAILPTRQAGQIAPAPRPASNIPQVGEIRKGYRFLGGDPSKKSSWEKQ